MLSNYFGGLETYVSCWPANPRDVPVSVHRWESYQTWPLCVHSGTRTVFLKLTQKHLLTGPFHQLLFDILLDIQNRTKLTTLQAAICRIPYPSVFPSVLALISTRQPSLLPLSVSMCSPASGHLSSEGGIPLRLRSLAEHLCWHSRPWNLG